MIYLNEKFFTEIKNENYIIHNNKIYRLTNTPKTLKTRYQLIHNTKIPKNKTVILTENNELTLIDAEKLLIK